MISRRNLFGFLMLPFVNKFATNSRIVNSDGSWYQILKDDKFIDVNKEDIKKGDIVRYYRVFNNTIVICECLGWIPPDNECLNNRDGCLYFEDSWRTGCKYFIPSMEIGFGRK